MEKDLLSSGAIAESIHLDLLTRASRTAKLGYWSLDVSNNTVFWSEEVYRIHGVSPKKFYPTLDNAIDFYHEDDREDVKLIIEKSIENQKEFTFEARIVMLDNQTVFVRASGECLVNENGEVSSVFGIIQDITDIAETQLALTRNKQHYEVATMGAHIGVWDWNCNTGEVFFNDQWFLLLGYNPGELPQSFETFQNLIHPTDLKSCMSALEAHLEGSVQSYKMEIRMRHKKGHWVWILTTGKIVETDENSAPVRVAGIHINISDDKKEQNILNTIFKVSSSDELLSDEKLIETLNAGLDYYGLDLGIISCVVDDEYSVRCASDNELIKIGDVFNIEDTYCAHTFGSPEVLSWHHIGETELAKHPCYESTGLESYIGTTIYVDNKPYGTLNFTSKNRREEPFTERQKSFLKLIAQNVGYEITRQKNIAEQKMLIKELEQANTELEEFSYRTSHDLRAPVVSVAAVLEIVETNLQKMQIEKGLEGLRLASLSVDKLKKLIDDIISLARTKSLQEEKQNINLQLVIEDALDRFEYLEGYEALSFNFSDIPGEDVFTYKSRLKTVVENLISNAIKYADFTKDQPRLDIEGSLKDGILKLSFTDNGIGIPEANREQLFEMFQRFHSEVSFGSGLGMYMTKKSAVFMGGDIEYIPLKSGSKFILTVPVT